MTPCHWVPATATMRGRLPSTGRSTAGPARRLASIAAALLIGPLVGCSPAPAASDAKPSPQASATGSASQAAGAPAGGSDLTLAEAIAKLSDGAEDRAGYELDSFHLWVDADKDSCDTRKEVLLAEAVKEPEQGARCALAGGELGV